MTLWLDSFLLRLTNSSFLTRSTSRRLRCLTSTGRIDVFAATIAAQYTCSHSSLEAAAAKSRVCSSAVNARQHTYVHVNRAVRNADLVPSSLELADRRGRDRRERHLTEVFLDQAQPL